MEGSPRRSTSLNFGLSELFLGSSYPPTFNLVPNSKICSMKDSGSLLKFPFPRTQKISHSVSMDDAVDSISDTKKNFVQSMTGMFGSLKNLVSKIPNFMSNINSPLSVTVVPNEGIISREDILQNLTGGSENLISDENHFGMFEGMNKSQTSPMTYGNGRAHISEIFTTKLLPNSSVHRKFKNVDDILVKTWNEDFCTENCLKSPFMNSSSQSNHTCQKKTSKEELYFSDTIESFSPEVNTNLVDSQDVNSKIVDDLVFIEKFSSSYSSSSDSGSPLKALDNSKSLVKQYTSIKCEFRSRKPSESSTDSEDSCFIVFEDGSQSELNCDYESLSDGDIDYEENQKPAKSRHFFRQPTSVHCDFQSRRTSESSSDSENSCIIVFKDEYECPDFNCKISSDEESEEDKKSDQKVRFNLEPVIHPMIKWEFAYRAARIGPWQEKARDRERFQNKINSLSQVLNSILTKEHREKIWQTRFAVQD